MLINEGGADFSMIKETDLLFKTLNPGAEISRDLSRQPKPNEAVETKGNVAVVAPRPAKQGKNR